MVSKLCNISFSLAGSTARSTCNWMGRPGPGARAPAALAPVASIVFKQVRRFIFPPLAHRRPQGVRNPIFTGLTHTFSLIELLLTLHGELDPVQACTCGDVK